MVKKLITAGAAAASILMLAGGVFAGSNHRPSQDVNVGVVTGNNVVAVANTGLNSQKGGKIQMMATGDAYAEAGQTNVVNSGCGCDGRGSTKNIGTVKNNNVVAVANTGLNTQTAGTSHGGGPHLMGGNGGGHGDHDFSIQMMATGDAAAVAYQWNVVNSSVVPN